MKHYDLKSVLRSYIISETVLALLALLNLVQGIMRKDLIYTLIFGVAFVAIVIVNIVEALDYQKDRRIVDVGVLKDFGKFLNANKAVLYPEEGMPIKFRIMGIPKKELAGLIGKKIEVQRTKSLKNAVEIKVLDEENL